MTCEVKTTVTMLTGPENYETWKQVITAQLEYEGIFDIVDGNEEVKDANGIKREKKALYIIKSAIAPSELRKTGVCNSAHALWTKLQQNYHGGDELLTEAISTEWSLFEPRKGEDFISYCGRFETLLVKLAAVDIKVPEINKHTTFSKKLSPEKRQYCQTWRMINKQGSIEELVSSMKMFHHQEEILNDTREESFITMSSKKGMKFNKKRNFKDTRTSSSKEQSKNFKKRDENSKEIICNHCKKQGHKWRQCFKLLEEMKSKDDKTKKEQITDERESIFITIETAFLGTMKEEEVWIADTGATSHITPYRHLLTDYVHLSNPKKILTGNRTGDALGHGTFYYTSAQGHGRLERVLYAPDFPVNIFSLDRVIKGGNDVLICGSRRTIDIATPTGEILLQGVNNKDSLSHFKLRKRDEKSEVKKNPFQCYLGATIDDWHRRFAHLSKGKLNRLMSPDIVKNLKITRSDEEKCIDCLLGKSCKVSHPSRTMTPTQEDQVIIHLDTAGPFRTKGYGNKLYYLMAVEEFSNYRFVKPATDKAEIKYLIKKLISEIKIETGKTVIGIHSDGGSEFVNDYLKQYFEENGIVHTVSARYTPQQNGTAEAAIKAINDATRTMLNSSQLPRNLWPFAAQTACYALNRALAPKRTKTRYELYFGVIPDVSNLKAFGQLGVTKIEPAQDKLGPKGKLVHFVGYTDRFNTFLVYDDSNKKVWESCNLRMLPFNYKIQEERFHYTPSVMKTIIRLRPDNNENPSRETEWKRSISPNEHEYEEINLDEILSGAHDETIDVDTPQNINDIIHDEILAGTRSPGSSSQNSIVSANSIPSAEPTRDKNVTFADVTPAHSTRSRVPRGGKAIFSKIPYSGRAPEYKKTGENSKEAQISPDGDDISENDEEKVFFSLDDEPSSLKEAMEREDWPMWESAIKDELNSLNKNKVFSIVEKPKKRLLKNRMIFKLKRNVDGSIDKYKARLVVKGYLQRPNIDFRETYSPVASLTTVRILLTLAVQLDLSIYQLDVKTAFLYGNLEEDLYMELPEGVEPDAGKACKLHKSLYGLRQAPRCWNEKFHQTLVKYKLKRSKFEDCFYFKDDLSIIMVIYVDDGLIACKDEEIFQSLTNHLENEFEITCRRASTFLNIQIERTADGLRLHQQHYIEKILTEYMMNECNPVLTPIETGEINFENSPLLDSTFPFKNIIGKLLYLALATRPDISLAVNVASRTGQPTTFHRDLIKRILRYLKGSNNLAIRIEKVNNFGFKGYSDADYANDVATRRSTSGYCIFLGNTPVYWRSARQSIVTLSTAEAEYVSSCDLIKELIPIRQMLLEIHAIGKSATQVYVDNKSAISMASDLQSRARTKHIDVRTRWISEKVHDETIEVKHISGENQLADIFTKPLAKPRFVWLRNFFLVTLLLGLVQNVTSKASYNFLQVNPVYYKTAPVYYVNNIVRYNLETFIMNGCQQYFGKISVNSTINNQLVKDCQGDWWPQHTWKNFGYCALIDEDMKAIRAPNNEISRFKRAAQAVIGIVIVGYIVVCAAVTYTVALVQNNTANMMVLKNALEDDKTSHALALKALNESTGFLKNVANENNNLNRRVTYIEETIADYPRIMATIAATFNYFEKIEGQLDNIDLEAASGKISTQLLKLTNETLWTRPAHTWSHLSHCRARNLTDGISLFLDFTIPLISDQIIILEADPISFWNKTDGDEWCYMKYAGPRYIMSNKTSSCFQHVQSNWLGNEGKTLEGHPCINPTYGLRSFEELGGVYHRSKCRKVFHSSTDDIIMKTNNGFTRIYCYGHSINIEGMAHDCPPYVFQLPYTTKFELNGQYHSAVSKVLAVQNIAENHIQLQIREVLKLDQIKIKKLDISPTAHATNLINNAFEKLNKTIQLKEINFPEAIKKPIESIGTAIHSVWYYLETVTIYLAIILVIFVIIALSPVVHLIAGAVRLVRFAITRSLRKVMDAAKSEKEENIPLDVESNTTNRYFSKLRNKRSRD